MSFCQHSKYMYFRNISVDVQKLGDMEKLDETWKQNGK